MVIGDNTALYYKLPHGKSDLGSNHTRSNSSTDIMIGDITKRNQQYHKQDSAITHKYSLSPSIDTRVLLGEATRQQKYMN
jgi:hypothetical protein